MKPCHASCQDRKNCNVRCAEMPLVRSLQRRARVWRPASTVEAVLSTLPYCTEACLECSARAATSAAAAAAASLSMQ
eukprot:11330-Heterococcus_DN1.PRE.2